MPDIANKTLGMVASLALLSACAAPAQQDIIVFGKTAEILAIGTADIFQRHIDLIGRLELETGVANYSDRQANSFAFPPGAIIDGEGDEARKVAAERAKLAGQERLLWLDRLRAMGAIRDYAKALADINDPLAAASAGAALATLGDSVTGITASALPQPAGQLAAGLVASAIRGRNVAALRTAIAQVHPLIEAATTALVDDFQTLQGAIEGNFEDWQAEAKQTLLILRRDPQVNAFDLQQAYRRAAERNLANAALVAAYSGTLASLKDFEAAHRALGMSRDDDRALSEFLATTGGFADSVARIRAGEP